MRHLGRLLIAIWAVLSVAALAQFLAEGSGPDLHGEVQIRLFYSLFILNFPVSALVTVVAPENGAITQWCIFTIAGFVQWVILLPALFRWYRRRQARGSVAEKSLGTAQDR